MSMNTNPDQVITGGDSRATQMDARRADDGGYNPLREESQVFISSKRSNELLPMMLNNIANGE